MSIFAEKPGKFGRAIRNRNVILPNFITILGLLCGVYSIMISVSSMDNKFVIAAYLLILASVFDGLDGKVARLVNGTSDFGVQLDSLCDLVSFGVAPAILMYEWVLISTNKIGIMAVFLYVACGALRLARFNVQAGKISNAYFVGLPIPGAAAFIASSVIFIDNMPELFALKGNIDKFSLSVFFLISTYVLAFLMVSSIPFYSFKKVSFFKEHPFQTLVILVLIVSVFVIQFEVFFFLTVFLYITINILLYLLKLCRRKKASTQVNG